MSKEITSPKDDGSSSSSEKGIDDFDTAMASMDTPDSPPSFNQDTIDQQQSYNEPASTSSSGPAQANTSGSRNTNTSNGNGTSNGDAKNQFGAPGSCWQSKKFHEEYERTESNLLDRSWNPTTYGDPLQRRNNA